MRSYSSFNSKTMRPLGRIGRTVVVGLGLLLIIVSACSRKPNLIPYGYEKIFEFPAISSSVAKIDYPIVYVVDPATNSITFRVKKEGERVWLWHGEFWTSIKSYQIGLIKKGDGDSICETAQTAPDAQKDVTEIRCDFPTGKTAKDYQDKALAALLNYYVDDPKPNVPPTGTVSRIYYLIPME